MLIYARIFLTISALAWHGCTNAPAVSQPDALRAQSVAPAKNTRVQTVPFQSQLVGKTLPYNVVLPIAYGQPSAQERRYPVLYLLHGLTGHYDNWTTKTRVSDHAASYEVIIVTPEGNDGWYTDSQMAPAEKYETYIIKELIPDVDRRFRTINAREGRAIAGLSMGGYGALKFGVKYPAMFAFAGSMSGAPNAASWTREESFDFIWSSLQPVFGDEGSATRAANDVPKLYRELSPEQIAALPYIYLDCGTGDHLLASNRNFVEILVEKRVPHEYRQLPGGHSWEYWDARVPEALKIAMKKMGKTVNSS